MTKHIKPISNVFEVLAFINILEMKAKGKEHLEQNMSAMWYFFLLNGLIEKNAIKKEEEPPNLHRYLEINFLIDSTDPNKYKNFINELNRQVESKVNRDKTKSFDNLSYEDVIANFTLKKENYLIETKILETFIIEYFKNRDKQ